MSLAKLQAWFFPLMILLIGCSNLIVIYVGGSKYINNEIAIGVLAEFIIYINMLTWPVAVVGWVTSIVQQAEASQKRINDFLKETPEIKDGQGVKIDIKGSIEFDDVSLFYPETKIKALKSVKLKISAGSTVGIIGNIGSGKTSLLNLIVRLYDPVSGVIKIDGIDIKKYSLKELRKAIAYVPQNNLGFGSKNAKFKDIVMASKKAAMHKNIISFLDGYKTLLGERGVTLSGGQIQRIAIARAILKDSEILLLDDCLSSVDSDTEMEILEHLKSISKSRTTIIVSHRISSLEHAEKIIVFENGKIVQQGKHVELVGVEGYYQELFKKQNAEHSK